MRTENIDEDRKLHLALYPGEIECAKRTLEQSTDRPKGGTSSDY